MTADTGVQTPPTLGDTLPVFARIGVLSFGGPAAQIALMHRMLVDETGWLQERQFLSALSFCMLLPGPEAMQLATYSGWRLHGWRGGVAAGLLFVLPGALVVLALAAIYAAFGTVPVMAALFLGVKAAVLVIVIEALLKVSRRALTGRAHYAIAAAAFVGIFFLNLPYPLIVVAAAAAGALLPRAPDGNAATTPVAGLRQTLRTIAVWLTVWLGPLAALALLGGAPVLTQAAQLFSTLAVVTFGGAYAVLAYLAQVVVTDYGWLSAGQMMDGLGLAETTPGPLILVTEFVGFLAGYQAGGWGLALAATAVTLWATFAPCFLWIFAGAPYIDWMSHQPRLSAALTGITAAVVGVILNLSIWFGLHVLFATVTLTHLGPVQLWLPDPATADWRVAVLAVLSAGALLWRHWSMPVVLALAALGGLALSAV